MVPSLNTLTSQNMESEMKKFLLDVFQSVVTEDS
jgi:hypothetical protein